MRFSLALCVLLAASTAAPAQIAAGQVQAARECHCQAGHRFGMEWDGKAAAPVDVRLPLPILDACERWAHLPERIEAAASWSAVLLGAAAATALLLALAAAVQFARPK